VTADKEKKECSAPSSLAWQNFMSHPLYLLGKNSDPNEQKAGKAPELVSAFSRRENYYPSRESNPGFARLHRSHHTDYAVCAPPLKVINVLNY